MNILYASLNCWGSNPRFEGVGEALHLLGHNIIPFPYRLLAEKWDIKRMNEQLIDLVKSSKIDVALIIKGDSIYPQTFKLMRDLGIYVAYWNMEATVNLSKEQATRDRANNSDLVFLCNEEGGKYIKHDRVLFSHYGFNPKYFMKKESQNKQYDTLLDGSMFKTEYVNRAVIGKHILDSGFTLKIIGDRHWLSGDARFKNILQFPRVNNNQMTYFYNRARIVICTYYEYASREYDGRIFQVMGSGTLVLSQKQKNIEKDFIDGKHLALFSTYDELVDKIGYYLKHEDEREKIADEGMKYVHSNFTTTQVVKNILDEVEKRR